MPLPRPPKPTSTPTFAAITAKLWRCLAEDDDFRKSAIELGVVDRDWLEHPDEQVRPPNPPLEVTRRLLERTVERRPSVLATIGLNAIEMLSWDTAYERSPNPGAQTSAEVAVLFTDLEGFTRFTAEHGDAAALELLGRHHETALPIIRGWGGRVVKRLGDGLMLVFPTPTSGVRAAVELVPTGPTPLRIRAGAHTGLAVVTKDDLLGHVVNVAARVTGQAEGGQVLVTAEVRKAVGDIPTVRFTGPWSRELKGIDEPVSVYQAESAV
ncbi:adenylate/guanylate cyclase domain-containing protein [Antrihabitans stalactiti]|uniref:Adenylate/guanylate cyclase domain-containing protein n=1 Tax=Antrihabitans stalactiti TaxID=2584121 RepID=A0A848KIV8_9NOCA|nr:adenylate/guanylate cyclase domain-containing protein [Antrihabitans stalactiti]